MMWYYSHAGETVGPVAHETLASLVRSGELAANDYVWSETLDGWQTVAATPEVLAPAPPPPPAPRVYTAPSTSPGDSVVMRAILPVGRSGWAIASGYLGLFCIFPLFGIAALVTGILGVRAIRGNRKLHGMGRCTFGIVMGGLSTAFYTWIMLSS